MTLVTYFRYSLFSGSIVVCRKRITFDPTQLVGKGLSCYFLITPRAIVIVVYYRQTEQKLYSQFLELCKSRARTQCVPYVLEGDTIPINKLKNMGIEKVTTTHFIFAENNLSPTSIG